MIDIIERIAKETGRKVMEIYHSDFEVVYKKDKSPITYADEIASEYIEQQLTTFFPTIPIINEEKSNVDFNTRKNWTKCWIIDPIDGTKEFVKKNGEFTINIALVENGEPIFGLIYAPAIDLMYYGAKGEGAFKKTDGVWGEIKPSPHYESLDKIIVASSRSHPDHAVNAFIKRLVAKGTEVAILQMGSSLKLCMVAEGRADIYPRFGDTMEWDIAAGHAIVKYAGKEVYQKGTLVPLKYNKHNFMNPHFLVA
jgi:3'(2'), 5'-bisphosphate nucleotidase